MGRCRRPSSLAFGRTANSDTANSSQRRPCNSCPIRCEHSSSRARSTESPRRTITRARDASGIDRGRHYRSQSARGNVIRVALQTRGFVQDTKRLPTETERMVRDHHPGGERRRARTEALADGNIVRDLQFDGRHDGAVIFGDGHRRPPDHVLRPRRNGRCVAPGGANRQAFGPAKTAGQIDLESETQGVEPRPKIRAGGRRPDGEPGHSTTVTGLVRGAWLNASKSLCAAWMRPRHEAGRSTLGIAHRRTPLRPVACDPTPSARAGSPGPSTVAAYPRRYPCRIRWTPSGHQTRRAGYADKAHRYLPDSRWRCRSRPASPDPSGRRLPGC